MRIIKQLPEPGEYWKYNTKEEKIIMSEKIRVLLDEETVEKRICEVAAQISEEYKGKEIHMICVLKGGVFFMCELAKRITVPVTLDSVSYTHLC